MPDVVFVVLMFGLVGLSVSSNAPGASSDQPSDANEDETDNDDSESPESPFASDADEPFDLDYEEPDDPSENPFAPDDETPADPESVPDSRPDGSSPFEDASPSEDDSSPAEPSSEETASARPDEPASDPAPAPPDASPEHSSSSKPTDEEAPRPSSSSSDSSSADAPLPEFSSQTSQSPDPLSEEASSPDPSMAEKDRLYTMSEARTLSDTAMAAIHNENLDRAFRLLRSHWPFSDDEMASLRREVERIRTVVAGRYGDSIDYRFVQTDEAAQVLVRFSYLERFDHHGLRWAFTFYQGRARWLMNDLSFNDDLYALLD